MINRRSDNFESRADNIHIKKAICAVLNCLYSCAVSGGGRCVFYSIDQNSCSDLFYDNRTFLFRNCQKT